MKVKVKPELSKLTDGRERFAGRPGVVERAPMGRMAQHPTDDLLPGDHFEHAYEVRFADGDEAIFLGSELEGAEVVDFKPLKGPAFGGRDAGTGADVGRVVVERHHGGKTYPPAGKGKK